MPRAQPFEHRLRTFSLIFIARTGMGQSRPIGGIFKSARMRPLLKGFQLPNALKKFSRGLHFPASRGRPRCLIQSSLSRSRLGSPKQRRKQNILADSVRRLGRTSVFGAIFLTRFLGGAICTHFRFGEIATAPQLVSLVLGAGRLGRPLSSRPARPNFVTFCK